ncbi:MAG: glucose-6-phosphate isomerase [Clostridia bacterium]|nr:glucose-6-phosphate isomerase [Clostridia bacterium]
MAVTLETRYANGFFKEEDLMALQPQVTQAHELLHGGTGEGSDFLGWLDLPVNYDREELSRIQAAAARIKQDTDVFLVIGIGGSYLGARAAIEFLKSNNYNNKKKDTPDIYFAGKSISGTQLSEILELCEGRRVSLNVISKSGTTTEPAIAFRVFRKWMENTYGREEAARRIYVTTDRQRGTLKELADREGYETFVVPDNVGGRFSVLTAVGLLPIAVAGCDVSALLQGAADARADFADSDLSRNQCYRYAAARSVLHRQGRSVEMMVSYEPQYAMMNEWWKQLFGESEGKDGKGLLPTSAIFSTDLHSLGQYIQEGANILFETVVKLNKPQRELFIEADTEDGDGLNFLAGKSLSFVNEKAFEGTVLAHTDGGTPNLVIEVTAMDEHSLGYLFYFFEKACAVSGYMLGVNPFNQPGVESYKKNMFALLGKPGYEEARAVLQARLGQ